MRTRHRRGGPPRDADNHERWLISYADFITLLLALFVVMYAMSKLHAGRDQVLSETLINAFGNGEAATPLDSAGGVPRGSLVVPDLRPLPGPPPPSARRAVVERAPTVPGEPTAEPETAPAVANRADEMPPPPPETLKREDIVQRGGEAAKAPPVLLEKVEMRLRDAMRDLIASDQVRVRRDANWVELEIRDNLLFTSGSAALNAQAGEPLARIAATLKPLPNRIQVEGFTDNVPISNSQFLSNWELSAARAASVVHVLSRGGVAAVRMAAIGYGEHRPVADNATPEGRNRNRRVVLVVLGEGDKRQQVQIDPKTVPRS